VHWTALPKQKLDSSVFANLPNVKINFDRLTQMFCRSEAEIRLEEDKQQQPSVTAV
jgi:hypothetical protein